MKINSGGWRGLWNEGMGLLTAGGRGESGEGESQFAFSKVSLKKDYVVLTAVRARTSGSSPSFPLHPLPRSCRPWHLFLPFRSPRAFREREREEDFDNVL